MPKIQPQRAIHEAERQTPEQLEILRFVAASQAHFRGDPRYIPENVTLGFQPRPAPAADETALLERICRAYTLAAGDPRQTSPGFRPTEWWNNIRKRALGPVVRALETGDLAFLAAAFGNFFRDPCSKGLIGLPFGIRSPRGAEAIPDLHRHACLGNALYRIDYWRSETGGRYPVADLAGPDIGNPFGVVVDGTLVRCGSEYQHYCAWRVRNLLPDGPSVLGEIGGGYGAMAYYLLHDRPPITYIDFDLPESLALAAYYLGKALPDSRLALYGEQRLDNAAAKFDLALMPLWAMGELPPQSLDCTFSSHVMNDLSDAALAAQLGVVARLTRDRFLYLGAAPAGSRILDASARFEMLAGRETAWNRHLAPDAPEGEYLYRIRRW